MTITSSTTTDKKNGLCGICPAGCFVTVTVNDGHLVEVEPQQGHPFGSLCRIGAHSPEIVHDPDRVLYPLRRTGRKGTHDFSRISWDEAYGTIVEKMNRIKAESGPEATAIYTGRGAFDMALCDLFQPAGVMVSSASSILFPFGSPNTLGVGALCYVSFAMIAPHVTMGEMLITMEVDVEQAELIVLWGANPATDSPPLTHQQVLKAREQGAAVVAIDPRRTATAKDAGAEWVPVRPGTDGALALGMIQVLIEEGLYDEKFVREWCIGFSELTSYVQHFRPEVVAEITSVPAETIRRLARTIAGSRGAAPVMYTGLEYSDSGVQAIRAVFILWGLAGQLDVPGGLLFRMKENIFPQNRSRLLPNPDVKKALGRDRFPVYSAYRGESHAVALPDAVLHGRPYRIRALLVVGGSIITAWPEPRVWTRTLEALDFLVTVNRYHTADSAYADIVLPAATGYEITSYMRFGPLFKIRERLIPPQGEARNDAMILAELAQRLGYGHLYPQTEEELLHVALEGSGFTLEQVRAAGGEARTPQVMMQYRKWEKGLLRPDGKQGFNTPSGKFEITSSLLAEHGYDPLPLYTEPGEGPLADPELAQDYPLVFNSGSRTTLDFRSQHHGVTGLAAHLPAPTVIINIEDAAELSIVEGERVRVETPRGYALFIARLTADILRGTVDAAMGGGGPLGSTAWQACNVNSLTDLGRFDPISGFPVYKTLLCRVVKADQEVCSKPPEIVSAASETDCDGNPPASTRITQPRTVYLDHNATTPVAHEVREAMLPFLDYDFGNPSSIHRIGNRARQAVEKARRIVASSLNCTARCIVFTGGGSEANNLALIGTARASGADRRHIITSSIEHPSVLAPCRALMAEGFDLTVLPVNREGMIEPAELEQALRPDTLLVSVMLANNETGALQPIRELAQLAHGYNALFHCDAVQAFGKIPVDVKELDVDLLSLSGHKIHASKGIGGLYVAAPVQLVPLIGGGGQERGLRAGTENVAGIAGLGKGVELAQQRLNENESVRLASLRDRLESEISAVIPTAFRNGPRHERLPNTVNMTLPGIRGESVVLMLDRRGIALSSGSACKSGSPEPSHALLAMGLSPEDAHCSIRLSLGCGTTEDEVDFFIEMLKQVAGAPTVVRFMPCR